jgi:hypothetical protein
MGKSAKARLLREHHSLSPIPPFSPIKNEHKHKHEKEPHFGLVFAPFLSFLAALREIFS